MALSFALSLQTMTQPAALMSTEGFVTLLRVKRKRNDPLQQAFGAHADCPPTLSPAVHDQHDSQWPTVLSTQNQSTVRSSAISSILTCRCAVVDGLSERPGKRSVSSAALAQLRLEDDKPDPQRFTHVASISGRELDWISSQEKLACLLQSSVSRWACLSLLVGSALYMQF